MSTNIPERVENIPLNYLLGEYCFRNITLTGYRILNDISNNKSVEAIPDWFKEANEKQKKYCLLLANFPAGDLKCGISFTNGLIRYVKSIVPLYFVQVKGGFDEYLQRNFRKKARYNLKRSVKLFGKSAGGNIDFRIYEKTSELDEFHNFAYEISRKTFQHKLLKVGLPDTKAFREELYRQAEQGRFFGYILLRDGEKIAFAYCVRHGIRMNYNIIGYDPRFSKESPGNVLLFLILKDLFSRPEIELFDFGVGEAQYKSIFSTNFSMVADVYYFHPFLKSAGIVFSHYVTEKISSSLGRFLERVGVKKKVRMWMRQLS